MCSKTIKHFFLINATGCSLTLLIKWFLSYYTCGFDPTERGGCIPYMMFRRSACLCFVSRGFLTLVNRGPNGDFHYSLWIRHVHLILERSLQIDHCHMYPTVIGESKTSKCQHILPCSLCFCMLHECMCA